MIIRHMIIRQIAHLPKMGYNVKRHSSINSGESITKACRKLEPMLAGVVPSRSDGQRIAAYQAFYIRWRFVFPKPDQVVAYFHRHCKIDLINMFCILLLYYDMCCNDGTKIKQYQASPDLLLNVLCLFRMKIDCPYSVFKIPK